LRALPSQYGFDSTAAFISAVRAASGKRRGRKPGKAKTAVSKVAGKRRKRAKINDAMRAEVKKLVEDGKTAKEIAKAVGISQPSVANIKKALGLVGKKKG
jgi:DNA invertase Pin-like site-specific DNA recombinase